MSKWKFTDFGGELYEAEYLEKFDFFVIQRIDRVTDVSFEFDVEEVEDYLNRGIWRRLS